MIDFSAFYKALEQDKALAKWRPHLQQRIEDVCAQKNGNLPQWLKILDDLPANTAQTCDLTKGTLQIGQDQEIDEAQRQQIEDALRQLIPWRKGPFSVFDVFIDTEWRSDWKWDRVAPHLAPLKDRRILDVGAGSGYHCWRMYGAGAQFVMGIDPWWLYIIQFEAIKHFIGEVPVFNLPLGIQDLPQNLPGFDTVFSMGVLYHRKSPIEHLQQLLQCLRKGGELVLETLVIDGEAGQVLVPDDRYGKMRNVWFLPSIPELTHWIKRCGFKDVRIVDVNQTSVEEQRRTDWMPSESLADFLDPIDQNLTIEGYPAPKRAVFLANRP